MQKKRLLTMTLLTLTLLFAFAGFNSALAQGEDTVTVVSVQVDPDPSNPVIFSVPVNLSITGDPNVTNDYIQGASLGHYFDPGTYLTIDSVTLTGGLAENPDFPQANAVDSLNLGVIGFVQFSPTKWIAPDQAGLIGTLWFTLEAGAPDHIVSIDSGFFPPAGNFILTNAGGQTVFPEFNAGTITVGSPAAAELAVSPTALTFNATEGGTNPASQSFNVSNAGSGDMDWNAAEAAGWFSLSATSGTVPPAVDVDVLVDITGLTAGTYVDTITVTAPGAANSPQEVEITLNLAEPTPLIGLSTDSLYFEATEGGADPASQTVTVSNDGGQTLNWSAAITGGWLSIDPTAGSLDGGLSEDISASVLIAGLTSGTYYDTITVTGNADNSPQEVEVVLVVTEPKTALLQVIHNAADPAADFVDIYIDDVLTIPNFEFRTATEFLEFPAEVEFVVGVAPAGSTGPGDIIASFPFTLADGETYVAIANGVLTPGDFAVNPDGIDIGFNIYPAAGISTAAGSGSEIDLIAFHGSTDAPTVDVVARGVGVLFDNLTYTDYGTYQTVPPAEYILDITPGDDNNNIVISFEADLSSLGGGAAVAFASGFLDPATNQNGAGFSLLAALPDGTVVEFPVYVPPPEIFVDPSEFVFDAVVNTNPADQTMDISNIGGGTLDFTLSNLSGWLSPAPTSGTAPETITLSVNTTGLTVGTYYDTITVASAGASNSPVEVPVTLNITDEDPVIVLDQAQFTFNLFEGDHQDVDDLGITNGGGGELNWSASNIEAWLSLNPTSGTAPSTVDLTVSSAGLAPGTYYDTISVTGVGATNSPQIAEVVLNVIEEALFQVTQDGTPIIDLTFEGEVSKSLDPQVINIATAGDPTAWEATFASGWLNVDPAAGTTPSDVTVSVDITGLDPGTYYDTLTITQTLGAKQGTVDIEIILILNEPQAQFVVTPDSLVFNTTSDINPAAQNLNIASDGEPLDWLASKSSNWLMLDMSSGSTPSDVSVSADVVGQALAPGTYYDTIIIVEDIVPAKEANPVEVPVYLIVEEAVQPDLMVDPLTLDFEATEGGMNPGAQSVDITNVGTGILDWTASFDAAWITVSSLSGTAPSTIDIGVDIAGLVAGDYMDTVTIEAAGALNSPQYIEISLLVNPASSQGGDTVWVGTDTTIVGQSAMVEISFANDNLISGIQVPLHFNTSVVVCDSVSFAGSRVEGADMLLAPIDSVEGTINIGVVPTESDLIPVGKGLMARLYFTGLVTGFSPIDTGFIDPASEYVFVDENVMPFYPEFYSGSVTVTEAAAPCIDADPMALSFEAVEGGSDPADQMVTVTNCGTGELSWTAALADGSWLAIDPTSGGDGTVITASAAIAGLTVGDYYDTITITDPAASNSPVDIPVMLTINEPGPATDTVRVESVNVVSSPTDPVVFDVEVSLYNIDPISAGSLGFYYNSGDITIDSISLDGGGAENMTINQSAAKPADMLAIVGFVGFSPAEWIPSGDSLLATLYFTLAANAPDQVIDIDSGFFPPAGQFILTNSSGTSVSPAFKAGTITVTSEVEPPALSVTPNSLLFEGEEGGVNNVIQNVYIDNTGGGTLDWNVSYDAAWLSVDPASGTGPDTLDVEVDITGLTAGTYVDTITVTADGADNSPQYVEVTLEITSPPPTGIEGIVKDSESGDPLADAAVELYDMYPGTPLATTMTDAVGNFLFEGLETGEYIIRAYKDGYYPSNVEVMLAKEALEIMLAPALDIVETYEWVNFYCDDNYLNGELIMPGDVIEAYDPTGVPCGQFFVTEPGSYGFMPVYRDDEYTEQTDEGCLPGDMVSFTINGYPAQTSEDAIWTENGDNWQICLDAQSVVTKCFELEAGWQLISWNVDTEIDDIEVLIGDIKNSIDVILSFETGALTYDPDLPNFNTLFEMDHFHGYWFRMLEPATFCVTGTPVDPTTPIALEAGWNLASYLPNEQDSVEHALQSIMDYLLVVLAFYDGGVSYDPDLAEFNTLNVMMPMFGYWIKVTEDVMLTYPGEADPMFAKVVPDAFSTNNNPYDMTVTNRWIDMFGSGVTVDGETLPQGSVVEAVDMNGNLCGRYTVRQDGMFGFMPVYGAENGSADGLVKGDEFRLRVDGQDTEETFAFGDEGDRILVTSLHLKSGGSNAVPTQYSLNQNYPNPFNPETTISFELPADSKVELTIYNILGEKVATLVNEFKPAGAYEVIWNGTRDDGSTVSSGIYFYRLNTGDYVKSMKMTLMK